MISTDFAQLERVLFPSFTMVASSHCLAVLVSCLVVLVPYGAEGCWRRAGDEKMLDVMRARLEILFIYRGKLAAILDFDAGHFCRDDTDCEAMGNKRMCNVGISRYWKLSID